MVVQICSNFNVNSCWDTSLWTRHSRLLKDECSRVWLSPGRSSSATKSLTLLVFSEMSWLNQNTVKMEPYPCKAPATTTMLTREDANCCLDVSFSQKNVRKTVNAYYDFLKAKMTHLHWLFCLIKIQNSITFSWLLHQTEKNKSSQLLKNIQQT